VQGVLPEWSCPVPGEEGSVLVTGGVRVPARPYIWAPLAYVNWAPFGPLHLPRHWRRSGLLLGWPAARSLLAGWQTAQTLLLGCMTAQALYYGHGRRPRLGSA